MGVSLTAPILRVRTHGCLPFRRKVLRSLSANPNDGRLHRVLARSPPELVRLERSRAPSPAPHRVTRGRGIGPKTGVKMKRSWVALIAGVCLLMAGSAGVAQAAKKPAKKVSATSALRTLDRQTTA